MRVRNCRYATAAPGDLERRRRITSHGERQLGVAAGEVVSPRGHLAGLNRKRWRAHRDLRANAAGVRRRPRETNADSGRAGFVMVDDRGSVEPGDDDVDGAVPIEVGERDALRDGRVGAEAPIVARISEREVVIVAERHAVCVEARELALLAVPRNRDNAVPNTLKRVRVTHVPPMAVYREEIFVAIEIHVEERRTPCPVGRRNAGVVGDLRPGAIAPTELQRVPHPLRTIVHEPYRFGQRHVRGELPLTLGEPRAHHVGGKEVDDPIAVHVGEIHRHAGVARLAHGTPRREMEIAMAIVDPELIRIFVVVAHVEVRRAVAVHVVKPRGEGEVIRIVRQGLAVLVDKTRTGDGHAREVAVTVVHEEQVRIGALGAYDAAEIGAILDAILLLPRVGHDVRATDLLHDLVEGAGLGRVRIERIPHLVRADVQIERAAAVDVGEREGGRGIAAGQSALGGRVAEMSFPVTQPQFDGTAEGSHDEIEVAIAVHVGECRARGRQPREIQPARGGHVCEVHAAIVVVERRRPLDRREKNVRSPIAVDVARGNAGTGQEIAIGHRVLIVDDVGVSQPGAPRLEQRETRVAATGDVERAPAIAALLMPRCIDGGRTGGSNDQQERGPSKNRGHAACVRVASRFIARMVRRACQDASALAGKTGSVGSTVEEGATTCNRARHSLSTRRRCRTASHAGSYTAQRRYSKAVHVPTDAPTG